MNDVCSADTKSHPCAETPSGAAGPSPIPCAVTARTAQYIDSISSLPPAPTLVTELLAVFREPDTEIDKVTRLIGYDPSLTAEILKRCNSAFFAGEQPLSDIFDAVTRLGFYEVYCLVLAMFSADTRSLPGACEGLDVNRLWHHSLATAVAASVISENLGDSKSAAFTSGILHDIGKLLLASVERARYAELLEQPGISGSDLLDAERAAFGVDHAELGGALLERWKLPEDIVSAVRFHHHPATASPFYQLTATTRLADQIAHHLDAQSKDVPDLIVAAGFELLRIDSARVALIIAQTETDFERVKALMQI
jgi:putative nucleotidyltransferase with HDIG domain